MSDVLFIPTSPRNIAMRPLDKGMVRNVPSQIADPSSFYDLKGYIPTLGGLKRVPPLRLYAQDQSIYPDDFPLRDLVVNWNLDGDRNLLLIGSRHVYLVDPISGLSRISWAYTPTTQGTVQQVAGIYQLSFAESLIGENVVVGDDLWITDNGEVKKFQIISITEDEGTTILQFRSPSHQYATIESGTYDFIIERVVRSVSPYIVDSVPVDGMTVFADDSNRGLICFDGQTDTLSLWNADQDPIITQITCVDYFVDRLWIGGIQEEGVNHRNRIRWTTPTNHREFPALNYVDLPDIEGEILRLKRLGAIHVCYMNTGIYIGRMTNYTDLPILYTQMDSGGVGLIGPRAVCSWIDGHYFVGQDDIYYMSASLAVQPIGTPVLRETVGRCQNPSGVYVVPDPKNERIVFGFPEGSEQIVKLWSFCYKTKGWSYEEISCSMMAYAGDVERFTFGNALLPIREYTKEIGAYRSSDVVRELFLGIDSYLLRTNQDGVRSDLIGPVEGFIESQDLDFDAPDEIKTINRLSLKIDRRLGIDEELRFEIWFSTDRGATWKSVPNGILIQVGQDEGRVNFLATGSLFRFRVRSMSVIRSYTITEFVLRWRLRGLETSY